MTGKNLPQKVGDVVRNLFRKHPAGEFADQSGDEPWSEKGNADARADDTRAEQAATTVYASKLQLIGLTRLQSALGDRWPAVATRVRTLAQKTIDKYMLPGDICEPNGDAGYYVLFAQLSPEDSRFKAEAIAREIERHLIGSNLGDVAECSAELVIVDAEGLSKPYPLGNGSAQGGNGTGESRAFADIQLESTVIWAGAGSDPDAHALTDAVQSPRPAAVVPMAPRRLSQVQWLYRPVWDFKHSAIILFGLTPSDCEWDLGDPSQMSESPVAPEFIAELDCAGAARAAADFEQMSQLKRRLPLLVEVHYATISDERRWAFYLGTIRKVPLSYRRLLVLELVGCPKSPTLAMNAFFTTMQTLGVRAAMRFNTVWQGPCLLKHLNFELATMRIRPDMPESRQTNALKCLVDHVVQPHTEYGIWGIQNRSVAAAAASSGIRYLSGVAIGHESPALPNAVRYSMADLHGSDVLH